MVRGVARHRHPAAMWRLCNDARVGTNHHDVLRVSTPDNVAIGYDVAGLGSRFIAQLLDTLIVGVLLLVVSVSVAAALGSSDSQGSVLVALAVGGASLFTYIGYFTLCELTTGGRTPGKSAGGRRALDGPAAAAQHRPDRRRAHGRWRGGDVLERPLPPPGRPPRGHGGGAGAVDGDVRRGRRTSARHAAHAGRRAANRRCREPRRARAERNPHVPPPPRAQPTAARPPCPRHDHPAARPHAAPGHSAGADVAARAVARASLHAAAGPDRAMTVETFVESRRDRWAELEDMLRRSRRGRLRDTPAAALERFGALSRDAASDLAIARRDFPDAEVTLYLNDLCARAYPLLHRSPPVRPR